MAVHRSVVKWFDAKKGYGFIVHPDGGADVFVHYSQIVNDKRFKTLRTGQEVEFQLADGPKGLHARSVIASEDPEEQAPAPREPAFQRGSYRPSGTFNPGSAFSGARAPSRFSRL